MSFTSIPLCFYPLRKILLDDDHAFSQSILLKMHGMNYTSYHSPKNLLMYLQHEYHPTFSKFDLIEKNSLTIDSSTQIIININIQKLTQMLSNPDYQDISVLFVDYHMPEIQGIDFLKEIRHLPFKKALITGEKDYKIAVDAFNLGLVDAYIRKDDPNFANKIQNVASELEWKYFVDLSRLILDITDFNFLRNIYFIPVFKQYIKDNNITAFCLTHIHGNFMTKNNLKEQKYVLIRNKMQLNELAKIAEEDGGSIETIENLKAGKAIPFFGSNEYWQLPASEWGKFLYPATAIKEDTNLVYAVISHR